MEHPTRWSDRGVLLSRFIFGSLHLAEAIKKFCGRSDNPAFEFVISQTSGPAIENLQRIGAGADLAAKILIDASVKMSISFRNPSRSRYAQTRAGTRSL